MQKEKKKTVTAKPLTRNSKYKTDSHRTTSVNPSFISLLLFPPLCPFLLLPVVVVFIAFHYCDYHLQSSGSYLYTVSSMQCGNRQIWLNSRPSTYWSCDTEDTRRLAERQEAAQAWVCRTTAPRQRALGETCFPGASRSLSAAQLASSWGQVAVISSLCTFLASGIKLGIQRMPSVSCLSSCSFLGDAFYLTGVSSPGK